MSAQDGDFLSAQDVDFWWPDRAAKNIIYAEDAAEGARHVFARETFLELYIKQPEFEARKEDFFKGWCMEELISRVCDFIDERGPSFPWLPWLPLTLLFAADVPVSFESTLSVNIEIEPFGSKPGESSEKKKARWKEYKSQIDKKLGGLYSGRLYKGSEEIVQRNVGWYFENKCRGRSINDIARELARQNVRDGKEVCSEREKVRDGIHSAEALLSLQPPEVWLELPS